MGAHDDTSVRRRSLSSQTELSGLLSIGSYGSSVCRYYRKCRHLARMEWHWIFHANVTGSSKLVISKGLFYSHLFDCIRRQFREIHRVLYNIGRLLTQRALTRYSITSLWRKTKKYLTRIRILGRNTMINQLTRQFAVFYSCLHKMAAWYNSHAYIHIILLFIYIIIYILNIYHIL